jgi:hypothetical protein
MTSLLRAIPMVLTLAGSLAAGPIYRVSFSGTISTTASSFDLAAGAMVEFGSLPGSRVSGWMDFDLGAAPVPEVQTAAGGFVTTTVRSTSLPVFIGHSLTIDGFAVPPSLFTVPAVFDQPILPIIPGSTVTTTTVTQQLSKSAKDMSAAQSLIGMSIFSNSWTGPQFGGGSLSNLTLLISSLTPFFTVPASGEFPSSWTASPIGDNGQIRFAVLLTDSTVSENFGIVQQYEVAGTFQIDSASGGFLRGSTAVPEPATLVLTAAGLAFLVVRRHPLHKSAPP